MRLGNDYLPPEWITYRQKWKHLHPDWEFMLWTKDNIPKLVNQHLYDSYSNTGHRSDILRYEILYLLGGVYVDIDMDPCRPIDKILDGIDAFCGQISKPWKADLGVQTVETAILGSIPKHSFYKYLVNQIDPWYKEHHWRSISERTGPQFFERQLDKWQLENGCSQMSKFSAKYFYPYRWDEKYLECKPYWKDAYAVHRWWGTWAEKKKK